MAKLSSFKVGDVLLTYGLDMNCHKCVVKTKVLSCDERGIVTYSDGCRILTKWEDMKHTNDYFPYSIEQEKAMQAYCDKAYDDWREACRKQLEEARQYHIERNERLKRIIKEKGCSDGTHMNFKLSRKSNFYRWKQYDIIYINEELNVFGMAEDKDTMFLGLDDLCVPTIIEIVKEVEG